MNTQTSRILLQYIGKQSSDYRTGLEGKSSQRAKTYLQSSQAPLEVLHINVPFLCTQSYGTLLRIKTTVSTIKTRSTKALQAIKLLLLGMALVLQNRKASFRNIERNIKKNAHIAFLLSKEKTSRPFSLGVTTLTQHNTTHEHSAIFFF